MGDETWQSWDDAPDAWPGDPVPDHALRAFLRLMDDGPVDLMSDVWGRYSTESPEMQRAEARRFLVQADWRLALSDRGRAFLHNRPEPKFQASPGTLAMERAQHVAADARAYRAEQQVKPLTAEVAKLRAEVAARGRRILRMQADAHRRNEEMTALHYVWCSGGCRGGLTEEIVAEAERNTKRLRLSLANQRCKEANAIARAALKNGAPNE